MAPQLDALAAPPEGPGESSSGPGDPVLFSGLRGHSTHGYTDTFRPDSAAQAGRWEVEKWTQRTTSKETPLKQGER